ncbi:hypothetical protein EDC01DRAFT_670795 [Geopyxis carbonaria]|nr:hypothetical protein EDC01DRAFT_670795 [Geopyxis carbonaria]
MQFLSSTIWVFVILHTTSPAHHSLLVHLHRSSPIPHPQYLVTSFHISPEYQRHTKFSTFFCVFHNIPQMKFVSTPPPLPTPSHLASTPSYPTEARTEGWLDMPKSTL